MNEPMLDERAETARGQLRTAVAARPIPPVGRVTAGAASAGRRHLGWRPVLAIGVAVAACAVGVAVVLRDDGSVDRQPAGGVPDARRVIDDLPEGFAPSGAFGPGAGVEAASELRSGWWIADPTLTHVAMVVPVASADEPNPMSGPDYMPDDVTTVAIDGHDATLFDSIEAGVDGMRVLVLHGDTTWYTIGARGLTDETLVAIARAALDDSVGAGELPSGLELLGVAPPTFALLSTPMGAGIPTGLCGVGYQRDATPTDGDPTDVEVIVLTASPDTRMATAQLALYFPGRTQVPGTAYSTAPFPGSDAVHVLAWQIGGISYLMIGTVSIDELVSAADSVRVATDDEWAALIALSAANDDQSSTGGSAVAASATTEAPVAESTAPRG